MWGKGGTLCASQSSPLPPRSFPQQLFSLGRFAAGAEVGHLAFRAAGPAGVADIAAEPDHAVIDVAPFGTGEEAHQILFDVHGIGVGGKAQTIADALDVGIHGQALVDAEGAEQHHIGRLAGHAGRVMSSSRRGGTSPP